MKYTWYILMFICFVLLFRRVEAGFIDLLIFFSGLLFGFLYIKSYLDETIEKLKVTIERMEL